MVIRVMECQLYVKRSTKKNLRQLKLSEMNTIIIKKIV